MSFFTKLFSKKNKTTKFPGVIVARIISIDQHPNADRLRIATLDTGSEKISVVCGAPNIEVGQYVPLATLGTTLPGGAVITKANLRGIESSGMLCAGDELGINNDHSGILLLKEARLGDSIDDYI